MSAGDKLFAGSIPEIYDSLFVPILFEPYAADLADRLCQLAPQTVLETAAGTGALTRALASRLPGSVRIVATDLNQPMLDRAASRQPGDERIAWRQADALALPFPEQAFDAVACQFGVMFFPDKVAAFRETRRVLKPGGHFLFNVWDRIADNEFADIVTDALATRFPNDPPRFMARVPHGYADTDLVRADVAAAGFSSVAVETVTHASRARSASDVALAYCQGSPLRNEIEARPGSPLEEATELAAEALRRRYGDGPIEGRIQAHVFRATR